MNTVRGTKGVATVRGSRIIGRSVDSGWSNDVTGGNGFSSV
jgi:hypothetical protein